MDNKRDDVRTRSLKAGLIIFNEGRSTFNCLIRNMSAGGAKLSFEQLPPLPARFVLRLSDGTERHCEIRWCRSLEMGVAFESASALMPVAMSAAALAGKGL